MKTHGLSHLPEYKVWANIIQRCTNPNSKSYPDYGGRGILPSQNWFDFAEFIRDMGQRPTPEHTIERIDNNLGYCKENCYWAPNRTIQGRNKRNNFLIDGATPMQQQEVTGLKESTLRFRKKAGWTDQQVLNTPLEGYYTCNGQTKKISEWAEITGIKAHTISSRLDKGWTVEEALKPEGRQKKRDKSSEEHKQAISEGLKRAYASGKRKPRGPTGKWARKFDCCIDCGTNSIPHKGHGRCEKCHEKTRNH